jgi:hypothetical protein
MKCPKCEYENGFNAETMENVIGEHGGFFTLPIEVKKIDPERFRDITRDVFSCPNCGILFAHV